MSSRQNTIRQRVPRRGGNPRAAAPAVLGSWGKRCRLGLLLFLAALALGLLLIPVLRARLSGLVMLFTQRSPHTLAGALRAAGGYAVPCSLLLSVFRAAVLPWLTPLLPLADGMVFGAAAGLLVSAAGALLAGAVCFWLSRLLLRNAVHLAEPPAVGRAAARWGGAWCCCALLVFPGATGVVGYLAGLSGVSFRRYLAGALPGEAAVLTACARFCSPYKTLLPSTARLCLALAGLAVLAACSVIILKEKVTR